MSCRSQKVSVAAGCSLVRSFESKSGSTPLKRACSSASNSTALRPGSAVPRPTRKDISAAIEAHASRSAVLPNPARPSTTTTTPVPAAAPRRSFRTRASSWSLPRKGGAALAPHGRTTFGIGPAADGLLTGPKRCKCTFGLGRETASEGLTS